MRRREDAGDRSCQAEGGDLRGFTDAAAKEDVVVVGKSGVEWLC